MGIGLCLELHKQNQNPVNIRKFVVHYDFKNSHQIQLQWHLHLYKDGFVQPVFLGNVFQTVGHETILDGSQFISMCVFNSLDLMLPWYMTAFKEMLQTCTVLLIVYYV